MTPIQKIQNQRWVTENLDAFLEREKLLDLFEFSDDTDLFMSHLRISLRNAIEEGVDPKFFVKTRFSILLIQFRNANQTDTSVEKKFLLNEFLDKDETPLVTPVKKRNLKRVYEEILVPIANYYEHTQPALKDKPGLISVKRGLAGLDRLSLEGGTIFSELLTGNGVIFQIAGIPDSQIIEDLIEKNFLIKFGLLYETGLGVFITNPLNLKDTLVEGLYIKSLDNTNRTLVHQFIY